MKTGIKVALGVGVGIYAGIGIATGVAMDIGQKALLGKSDKSNCIGSGIAWPVTVAQAATILNELLKAFK